MAKSALDQVFEQLGKFTQGFGKTNSGPIISPLPNKDTLNTPGKLDYVNNNQYMEQQAKQNPAPETINKTIQYPDWMSNAASPEAMNAIKTIRQVNPNLKMSDADIAVYYNKHGEKLLQGINAGKTIQTTPTPVAPKNDGFGKIAQAQAQTQEPTSTPTAPTFRFQNEVNQACKQFGLSPSDFHLLRAGENQAENPNAINKNSNGTLDVGLYQINVAANNIDEINRLKNPLYNTQRAAEIFSSRTKILGDPVLTIASYNLGAGGAVLRPLDALKRAQWVYYKAGLPMPQTEFTRDPIGYVNRRMDLYKQWGLFK